MEPGKNHRSNIISFTSDFGNEDGYVGIVKGAILNINPEAQIVDLGHELKPFDADSASWIIFNSYRFFPKGSVHLVVVDPKVGSSQRRLLLTNGEHHFVGPDSGVFSMVLSSRGSFRAYELKNEIFFLQDISSSFHARDIFGPVSAHLSLGIEPAKFGPEVEIESLDSSLYEPARVDSASIGGTVIYTDRFGNLISNIPNEAIPQAISSGLSLKIGESTIKEISQTYSSKGPGELLAFMGSHGFLEIAVNQGNAKKQLGCSTGESITLS